MNMVEQQSYAVNQNEKQQTIVSFDLLRVTACFLVVMLHTAAAKFYTFDQHWWASNFYDSLSRCSVPVFFMISGALLLTKQDNIFLFYKKRVVRILPPLIAWSLIYMWWNSYHGVSYGGVWNWIKAICKGPVFFHLWYLYCIVGVYLFVPFLRKIYSKSDKNEKIIFLLTCFFCSSLPSLSILFDIKADIVTVYRLQYFSGYIGYLFAGVFLCEYSKEYGMNSHQVINIIGYFLSTLSIMFFTWLFSKMNGSPVEYFYQYLSVFVILSSLFFYNTFYKIGLSLNSFCGRILHSLSQLTLGIYCLHILALDRLQVYLSISPHMGSAWWAIPVTAVSAFCLSALIIAGVRQIKIVRFIT